MNIEKMKNELDILKEKKNKIDILFFFENDTEIIKEELYYTNKEDIINYYNEKIKLKNENKDYKIKYLLYYKLNLDIDTLNKTNYNIKNNLYAFKMYSDLEDLNMEDLINNKDINRFENTDSLLFFINEKNKKKISKNKTKKNIKK